jgi:hypothetical protein
MGGLAVSQLLYYCSLDLDSIHYHVSFWLASSRREVEDKLMMGTLIAEHSV